jgi:integrase
MAEHRGHNEGTIVERKNKHGVVTGYQVQITVAGGRRSHTAKTRAEARRWLGQAKADARQGTLTIRRPPTLAAYLSETWLATIGDKVKSRTQASYTLNVKRVPEQLGAVRLDELKPAQFQRFYNDLTASGLAPRTVRQVHMSLHKAFEDALRLDLIGRNPTDAVVLPRVPQKEMNWYNDAELGQLFDATTGDRFHALWVVLGSLGLRLGEALGLKWSDINWTRGTVTVQRTLHRDRLSGTLELQEPKTKGSRRTLTLPLETVAALRAHQDRQDFERRRLTEVWQDHNFVFCTGFGTPLDQGRIHHHWTAAVRKAGLPRYRIHDLRHSVASNLIAAGMGLLEVALLLGHRNATMVTQVYGHVAPDDHRRAASIMDALLARQRAKV